MRRILLAVILLAITTVAVVIAFTGVLGVRRVEVVGVSGSRIAAVEQVDGLVAGEPLIKLDVAAVKRSIEGQLDDLVVVSVQRRWPRTVRIVVRPRTVAANVVTGSGTRWVDAGGAEFGPSGQERRGVPTIVVTGAAAQSADQRAQAVRDGLIVIGSLPPKVRSRVVRVGYGTVDDIRLTLTPAGVKVRWGSVDQSPHKAQVLTALLARKALVYDVSAPDLPTTQGMQPRPRRTRG